MTYFAFTHIADKIIQNSLEDKTQKEYIFMTDIYFVRHAEPDYTNHDDLARPLTEKGQKDTQLVCDFFADKNIDIAFSSPYIRSIDTIMPFCKQQKLEINIESDFRERAVSSDWISGFDDFAQKQWADFTYKLNGGEGIQEVQKRNISALENVLFENKDKKIIVASHGTALSTIINYYADGFGYEDFHRIKKLMPWIVHFVFDDIKCIQLTEYDPFTTRQIEWKISK